MTISLTNEHVSEPASMPKFYCPCLNVNWYLAPTLSPALSFNCRVAIILYLLLSSDDNLYFLFTVVGYYLTVSPEDPRMGETGCRDKLNF